MRRLSEVYPELGHGGHDREAHLKDPVVYEVFEWQTGLAATDLLCAVTVLFGTVDQERPLRTRGHFHKDPDGGELVIGLMGRGRLDLLSRQGEIRQLPVEPGTWAQVPPGWAHRVTNVDSDPMAFLSSCSAAVGHDYEGVPKGSWVGQLRGREET